MRNTLILTAFAVMLILSILSGASILYALAGGYVLFAGLALSQGFSAREVLQMSVEGVRKLADILITFMFIGMLTASWRACGTIAEIVVFAAGLIDPSFFLVLIFLANAFLSVLTGTSFGTVATMGVISMAIGTALGIPAVYTGGAVLSGIYVGDRWSPMSTSAMLVAAVTGTSVRRNLGSMLGNGVLSALAASALYLVIGFMHPGAGTVPDVKAVFTAVFRLHPLVLIPAAIVVILMAAGIRVRVVMGLSTVSAALICIFYQGMPAADVLRFLVMGFETEDSAVGALMNGGGIVSFVFGALILIISGSYAGIFDRTHLLDGLKNLLELLARKVSVFSGVAAAALLTCGVSCNQSLATILTDSLCRDIRPDNEKRALEIEDTVIVMAPMLPWSIACAIPLAIIGAPVSSILFAFYLFLIPLFRALMHRDRLS